MTTTIEPVCFPFDSSVDGELSDICERVERCEFGDSSDDEELCHLCDEAERVLNEKQHREGAVKRVIDGDITINETTKRTKYELKPSTSTAAINGIFNDVIHCKSNTPVTRQPYPGCREALRSAFIRRGTPPEAMPLILASLADTTLRLYSVTLKLWWDFSASKNLDPFCHSKKYILLFLSEQHAKGCSYGRLKSHRAALSLFMDDETVSNGCVKRLLKGAYKSSSSVPKYTWDPKSVLNVISTWYPNRQLSFERITKKLIMLLAIFTAHRVKTFSQIKVETVQTLKNGIKIVINGRDQTVIFLPFFRLNPNICPASTLKDYLVVSRTFRAGNTGPLFLTYKPPHRKATSPSLGRWIKQGLSECTSAAYAASISLETIRKSLGWGVCSQNCNR